MNHYYYSQHMNLNIYALNKVLRRKQVSLEIADETRATRRPTANECDVYENVNEFTCWGGKNERVL